MGMDLCSFFLIATDIDVSDDRPSQQTKALLQVLDPISLRLTCRSEDEGFVFTRRSRVRHSITSSL